MRSASINDTGFFIPKILTFILQNGIDNLVLDNFGQQPFENNKNETEEI